MNQGGPAADQHRGTEAQRKMAGVGSREREGYQAGIIKSRVEWRRDAQDGRVVNKSRCGKSGVL